MNLHLNLFKLRKRNNKLLHSIIGICAMVATMAPVCGMTSLAVPIIDTTAVQTISSTSTSESQTMQATNITTAQMVSAPGNASAQTVSTPGSTGMQTLPASSGVNIQQSAPMPGTTIQTTTLTSASGVGELWMLASTTGAQNLSIVIKSPHGKLIVVDGGWEADATKLSELILQQGGKVDAWLITHPHEDHVGALCAILNDSSRKIKIDKIYCSLATPDWYRQVSPTGAGIADQLLSAFTKLPVGTVTNNIGRGTEINIDDVNIRVLNNRGVYTYNGVNNSSMVYKIRVSGQSILILGDLAYDGGKDLIKTCTVAELKSDIVQMAHHGQQGVDQDAYALIAPTTCLWPTPAWLWNNDNGGGVGSGPWGTLKTRAWMDALGVKDNRSLKDGDVHMYLGMPSPNM